MDRAPRDPTAARHMIFVRDLFSILSDLCPRFLISNRKERRLLALHIFELIISGATFERRLTPRKKKLLFFE